MNSSVWSVRAFIYVVSFKIKKQLGHGLFGEYLQLFLFYDLCTWELTFLKENLDILLFLYDCKGEKEN